MQVTNTGTGVALVEVIYNGTLTGGSFASVDAESAVEVDTAATAITGGIAVASFYLASSNQAKASLFKGLNARLPFALDMAGLNPTNMTVVITNIGSVTVLAAGEWQEYR